MSKNPFGDLKPAHTQGSAVGIHFGATRSAVCPLHTQLKRFIHSVASPGDGGQKEGGWGVRHGPHTQAARLAKKPSSFATKKGPRNPPFTATKALHHLANTCHCPIHCSQTLASTGADSHKSGVRTRHGSRKARWGRGGGATLNRAISCASSSVVQSATSFVKHAALPSLGGLRNGPKMASCVQGPASKQPCCWSRERGFHRSSAPKRPCRPTSVPYLQGCWRGPPCPSSIFKCLVIPLCLSLSLCVCVGSGPNNRYRKAVACATVRRVTYWVVLGSIMQCAGGGGGGVACRLGVLFASAAGGAYWPIAIRCPSLGPFPSIGGGAHRPLTALCPSSSSLSCLSLSALCRGGGGWHKASVLGWGGGGSP